MSRYAARRSLRAPAGKSAVCERPFFPHEQRCGILAQRNRGDYAGRRLEPGMKALREALGVGVRLIVADDHRMVREGLTSLGG